ncbi:helix-turn-helix transcriptional regulator [Frigoribacterium sp. CFBP 13729]|uniref:TetR/AcrR family transcriptional regulator n=1 Tax=Frigoribacterium sp. CFBP 13729 TaxID=2775293 RepID=UPI00177DE18F|nr:helix-turn-helix domain-containing protein [Frigoribacterium sp. CFBP 13729]MBD8611964.1 helix-turn-helix transcriptional regulator [Frigoribacterium sp. CFBP 13729]
MARWAPDAALRLEEAAMSLFAEHGFASTTVPQIAERAGLTTRTFFRHFADKRDVLFLRQREFPEVVSRLVAAAPDGLGPLDLAMHGVEVVAAGDLQRWRPEVAARRAVVRSEPQLRERELLRAAALADAIAEALVETGVPGADASLVARTASVLFESSLEDWIAGPDDVLLVDVVRAARRRLDRLVVGG